MSAPSAPPPYSDKSNQIYPQQQPQPGYPQQPGIHPAQQPGAYPNQQSGASYPQQSGAYPPQQPGASYPPQQPGAFQAQQPGAYPTQQPGAYQVQQPGYYPPPQPGQPYPVIIMPYQLGFYPANMTCNKCNQQVVTQVHYEIGALTWIICIVLVIFGLIFGCCLIPFCVDGCKDAVHNCPNCKNIIGVQKRM